MDKLRGLCYTRYGSELPLFWPTLTDPVTDTLHRHQLTDSLARLRPPTVPDVFYYAPR